MTRAATVLTSTSDQLTVLIGNQAPALVDLRQQASISAYLLGANVFPRTGTNSVDAPNTGFMSYDSPLPGQLAAAHIKLLRFPGGDWGEQHLLSGEQIDAFQGLLAQTGAQGMIQARLTGEGTLQDRANQAAGWVEHNRNVTLWTVGNEPDLLENPDTHRRFTAAEYTDAFIQLSVAMHRAHPSIRIFGPELSRFNGIGAGPKDVTGQEWMTTFLEGVGAFERSHQGIGFHLLNGISFHFYPDPTQEPASLLSNAQSWSYLLPPLRAEIRHALHRDSEIAVTEINANAVKQQPPAGVASLWWADTLGALMTEEVGFVAFFATKAVDNPRPLFTQSDEPTSMYRVLQLFAQLQPELIPVTAERDPISLYATQDASHDTVGLLLVNKAPDTQLAQVRAENDFLGAHAWPDIDLALPASSITLLTLHRRSGADAYTYRPAADAQPVHTICGHKHDALDRSVPC